MEKKFVRLEKIIREGFVLNVYDPLSFDIDISFLSEDKISFLEEYPVCMSEYIYLDSLNAGEKVGKAYRFRLFGVRFKFKDTKGSLIHNYVRNCLNRSKPFVRIEILAIDIYSRFLGNLYSDVFGELGTHLVNKFPEAFQIY